MKRFIASILSAVLMFNSLMPAYAAAEQDGKESATIKHFTLTADVIPGKLEELERYDVSMIDHGDVLENEEGVVVSEIQGTYYRNQKLTQSSLSGTSFAFAPIMLDKYFPLPQETPEPSETPEPTVTPESTVMPDASATPEVSITPDASVSPDVSATPEGAVTPSPLPEVSNTPASSDDSAGNETPSPTEGNTEQPIVEPTVEPTEEPVDKPTEAPVTEPTQTPEAPTREQPTEEPTVAPEEKTEQKATAEPAQSPEETSNESFDIPEDQTVTEENKSEPSASFWSWLVSTAYADESAPSSIRGKRQSYSRSAGCEWITYPGLFDAVTDVELSMTSTGIKENIVVHQYTGNHVYAYQMTTEGLTAVQSGKEILLYNTNGDMMAKVEAPHMSDAEGRYSTDIAVSLEGGGGNYRVTYRPNDEWMQSAAYPVTIDPTGNYFNDLATGIGDVFVSSDNPSHHYDHTVPRGSAQHDHNREGTNLYAGNGNIAYIIPALTGFAGSDGKVSEFPTTSGLMILDATWKVYVHEGGGTFEVALVTGDWNTSTVTYNSRPSLSADIRQTITLRTGWNNVDLTKIFSAWFNTSDQKRNYGFAVTSTSSWARICSADVLPRSDRMSFSASYTDDLPAPTVTAIGYGNGVNSQSGYIDVSWNSVPLASRYRLGISNGSTFQYIDVGNVTSYSTRGKKIWPTNAEMAAGNYTLHWDGTGQELPNIPRKDKTDLNYYFVVLPANAYGQTGSQYGQAQASLPDTTPPNQPSTVSVSPADWSSADARTVTWAGVTDMPLNSAALGDNGHVQFVLDPASGTDANTWAWQNTASNAANGSQTFSTAGLEDGVHAVYVRGVDTYGNYGAPKGAELKLDRTPPTQPDVTILPDAWTKENTASISWTNIADLNDLNRVEFSWDGGAYQATGLSEKTYAGYEADISSFADGLHTLSIRGVDIAGNVGKAGTASIQIDRSAPTLTQSSVEPAAWTAADSVLLTWEGAADAYSGLAYMEYAVDGGAWEALDVSENGSREIEVGELANGEHRITLRLTDALENTATWEHTIYLDHTPPVVELLTPQNGAVVTGVLDIWGTVSDISLTDWTLTAKGSSGKEVIVHADSTERLSEQLGVLDTGEFADGETIEIILTAHDAAAHESTIQGVYVKADHSAKSISADVTITAPQQGERLTTAYKQGEYTTDYSGSESSGVFMLDGQLGGATTHLTFPVYPILYPENSIHALSVLSFDRQNVLHYSQGMAGTLILSDIWKDENKVASADGLTLSEMGAEVTADSGTLVSKTFTAAQPVLAVQLHTIEHLAAGGSISYEVSTDHGATWTAIQENHDVKFDTPQLQVAVRAHLKGTGTVLQGLDIVGVYESTPVHFSVRLLRPVTAFNLTHEEEHTEAMPALSTDCTAQLTVQRLYMDGQWNSNSFTANMLPFEDGTIHQVVALGLDANGVLYGSGAAVSILMRTALNATDTWQSPALQLADETYAIRLETLCLDTAGKTVENGTYAYSYDGTTWTDFTTDGYTFLSRGTKKLYIRAILPSGVTLRAIHLEGVTAKTRALKTTLVKAPYNVQATDYGDYYENEKLRRYELTWSDANRDDGTCGNELWFDIYRNGRKIASTQKTRYADYDYEADAVYHVLAHRAYDDPGDGLSSMLTRMSERVKAAMTHLAAEKRMEGVQHNVENFTQSEYLNDLYGGNYTFSDTPNPPSPSFALDQSLLGPHRFCSLGFEPINFNTGNFYLQTRDYALADLGTSGFDVVRTYNAQSNETDGPFGAKWATEYSQHLRLFNDGSIGYRRTDGSEVIFYVQTDGTFESNSTEYEALSYDAAHTEYRISLTDGTVYAFASGGLLKRIEKDNGQHVTEIVRDEDGLMTKIISPSQEELLVEMDQAGHIVGITTPGDVTLHYTYSGKKLSSFTDAEGKTTKYTYDKKGRMTEWYDGNGQHQVLNKYDEQDRVIEQQDGNHGRYRMQYGDGQTITTDAEGNVVTYFFDEQKRTTRIVDALGGETSFTYGEQGEIVSKTDALGHVTTYAYNAAGDIVTTVLENGGTIRKEYNDQHKITKLTDLNGAVTLYEYDTDGNLVRETAPNGGVTTYAYDHKGRLTQKTDALGNQTSYAYVNGLLTQTVDALGNKTVYSYDANGNLASKTDALGNVTQYEYDANGNLLTIIFADRTSVSYTYDALGRQTSATDPLGNVTRYKYDALGNVLEVTLPDQTTQTATYTHNSQLATVKDALRNQTKYTYDGNGNRLTETDALGHTTTSEYDAAGHLISETNAAGGVTTYRYDAQGFPISVTDAAGATQNYRYDVMGNMIEQTLPNGATIRMDYDESGNVIRKVNELGGETTIAYDLLGRIITITDPLGAVTAYSYDANGNLLSVTDALGNVTAYEYDALNRVTAEIAPNGGKTVYAYDCVGNLIETTDALGYTTTYDYDAAGNLIGMTDALGQAVELKYDKNGRATTAVQKNGGVLATAYDKAGRIISETDANKHTTKYRYGKTGLVSEIIDALGQKALFEYDALGNVTKITAPGNTVTQYAYDISGRLTMQTNATGLVTEYGYNENSQLTSAVTNGNESLYEYDAMGNVSSVTDAEGRCVKLAYDLNGNLTEILYPDGTKDVTEYDALGRVVQSMPRTGLATAYAYDESGNIVRVTQGEQTTAYEYDLLGRMVRQIAADGTETAYTYDALGNLVGQTDELGNRTTFSYTAESLLEQVTYANGASQSLSYDLAGNVIGETDAEGNAKQYQYDKANRLIAVIDEMGGKTAYAYDAMDHIVQVTDALRHTTKYTYDKAGNLTSETDALGNKVRYSYTPEGWLSSVTKADGAVMTFEYDKTGALTRQNVGDEQSITSSYNEIGKLTEVSSEAGTIRYQYNEQGFLISVENVNGDVVSYTYDAYGNKTSMTYPDGRTVSYVYDAMNRMVGVVGLDGETTSYVYDAAGRRIQTVSGDLTTHYAYDSVGNLTEQATSGASDIAFRYSYNRNGYITGEKRTENGTTTENSYAYNALGELTSFLQSTGYGESYAYDKAGNMLEKVITGTDGQHVTLKMAYNAANQLTGMTNGQSKLAYSYDKNGSLTQKTLTSKTYGKLTDRYAYDTLDQLTSYIGYDGYQQQFTYDANGMRLSKKETGDASRSTLEELLRGNIAGLPEIVAPQAQNDAADVPEELAWATTDYLYDVTQEYYQVITETRTKTDGHTETTAYAYGLERIAAYTADGKTSYVYDGRGSVVQAVTAPVAGEKVSSVLPDVTVKVQSFSYTAFGEQMGVQKVSGFAYNAEAFDAATGMLNLRARQYEPTMNRFSQKDIVRGNAFFPLSLKWYVFAMNSPLTYHDPDGMKAKVRVTDRLRKGTALSNGKINITGSYKLTVGEYTISINGEKLSPALSLKSARVQAKQEAKEQMIKLISTMAMSRIRLVEKANDFSEARARANEAVEFMNKYKDYLSADLVARLKKLKGKERGVKGSKSIRKEGVSIARITMCIQVLYDDGVIKTADEAIETYSRLTKDSVLTKTPDEFLASAARLEGKAYSEVDCAGLISKALAKYASSTGMTKMYQNDQVVGGTITSIEQLKALPVGTIVGQLAGTAGSQTATLEKGAIVNHGGIIVMHDFGDGNEKAIFQSRGPIAGGPAYTRILDLGLWNIWFWHDGVTN